MDVPYVPEFAAAGWHDSAWTHILAKDEQAKFFRGRCTARPMRASLWGVPGSTTAPVSTTRRGPAPAQGLKPPKTYDELRDAR